MSCRGHRGFILASAGLFVILGAFGCSEAGGGGGAGGRGGGASDGGSAGHSSGAEPFVFGVPPAAASHFTKGINLGNRLEAPNEGDWGGTIQAEDFPFIAQRGFDHVRIPIRFSGHALAAAPYTIDAAFFSRVDTVLNQAAAANLAVVVDMHAYDELAADVTAQRDRFVALWTQIAARYQGRPDTRRVRAAQRTQRPARHDLERRHAPRDRGHPRDQPAAPADRRLGLLGRSDQAVGR